MDRRSWWIGFLAGGWIATMAVVFLLPSLGVRSARAEDPPGPAGPGGQSPFGPTGPTFPGPTVNPLDAGREPKGLPSMGGGTSDSNRTAIALSASIGNGESAVYYFDTEAKRLLVYQYRGVIGHNRTLGSGDTGGLRLLAARHIDYDLQLSSYRDLSEKTRNELKEMMVESSAGGSGAPGPASKTVNVPGGFR
jgi:hypothetical protein